VLTRISSWEATNSGTEKGKSLGCPPNSEGTASQWETLKLKITEVTNNTMRLVAANRSHVSICPGQAV